MKGLITFVMKGRMQAIMATAITAVLALLVTPLSLLSAAVVVLATLRNGAREGLVVALSATLVMVGLGGLLFQMPVALALMGVMLWLPAWGLASVLGQSGSLAKALEATAFGGMLLVAAQYLVLPDPTAFWGEMLNEFLLGRFDPAQIPVEDQKKLIDYMAGWMPGGVAASWMFGASLSLVLGRWAEAVLAKPGAFGEEFRGLRFSKAWLIAVPALLIGSLLGADDQPSILGQLYLVGMMLFVLQGLSVAHGMLQRFEASTGWLFGLYFVLLVGAPHSVTAVAAAGYADGWLNFRAKSGSPPDKPSE